MNSGRTVFSQLIQHLPEKEFQKCVARHHGDSHCRGCSCWDQLLAMAFAQLTYRESSCATSRPVCVLYQASCIIWDSVAKYRVRLWPMRTNRMTGVSSPISRTY